MGSKITDQLFSFSFPALKNKLINVIKTNEKRLSFAILSPKCMFQIHLFTHRCGQQSEKKLAVIRAESFLHTSRGRESPLQPCLFSLGSVSWQGDTAGPSAHRPRFSITSAKAPVFFHARLSSGREAQHTSESGKLLSPSLARAPQSLLVCRNPPVQITCLPANI